MTEQKRNPKAGMNRGTKLLLASFSVATTLSGWAWLTLTQPAPDVQADQPEPVALAADAQQGQTISGVGESKLQALPTADIPSLANLPVRGLRRVGFATPVVNNTAVPQVQVPTAAPQQQQQQQGGGNQSSNVGNPQPSHQVQPPPPPPPKPPPPPPPKRKTKSSRP